MKSQLHAYDKNKVALLKSILPILIIIHHLANEGFQGIQKIGALGDIVMYLFFAMSGYGLVTSYLKDKTYIKKFLGRSLVKLFVPYFIAMILFVTYRYVNDIDNVELLRTNGLYSFVPTSWYIYVLSYLYIFYYVVFKYIKSSNIIKVTLVCMLVFAYYFIAPKIGIESWRYNRCPAFCIGMFFALFDNKIKESFVVWQVLIAILILVFLYPFRWTFQCLPPLYYSTIFFLVMYIIGNVKQNKIVNFISSISLEMFIIQYIPIYIITNDLHITSTLIAVTIVLLMDIAIAYYMNKFDKHITKKLL